MRVRSVIERVRNIAGDTDSLQFTDAQIIDWINDGIKECAIVNNLMQKRASNITQASVSQYSLPSDILKLHSVKYKGNKLPVLTLQEFEERFDGSDDNPMEGVPSICYIWAGLLNLYPVPTEAESLVIDYLYEPPNHSQANADTEEVNLPSSYHMRIVDYCLAQVAQQDDDLTRYAAKMEEFRTGINSLKDQPENTYDLYPFISVANRDMGFDYIDGEFYYG